jgi:hypothetical protein
VPRDLPADIADLVRPWVTLVPSDTPAVTIVVDPADPAFAPYPPDVIGVTLSQIADSDAHFLSSRIVFKSDADVRRPGALAHEFGHALGLGTASGSRISCSRARRDHRRFSARMNEFCSR